MLPIQTRSKVKKNFEAHALNWKMKVRLMICKRNYCSSKFRRHEEGIGYDEVFAHVARIEAIRIFLAFASYMGFIIYQMDVKSAFLYCTIDEEVYVTQPPGIVDPKFFKKDTYVAEILKKFDFLSVKTARTSIETQKHLVKDKEAIAVDVTPKTSHLQAVKMIFRYLKGQPKFGLWYPKVSSFNLQAYSDSDYASANHDRKSTTGEEISSGSTTTHSDISLPNYKAFYFDDDHIEDISSGSTTTHSYISLSEYVSFIFDPSNDLFPPTNRSDFTHEKFTDELAHIIAPPEYDCFYLRNLPDPSELISNLDSGICENLSSTTRVNLPVEDDHSPLLAYVVLIFLAYLTYPIIPYYLQSFGNEELSLTQASPLIVFIRLSRVYLIDVELSRNSILTVVT
nr:putative ribonuclease H-like domain-containing protein [Tanacetum cinerariifolium]